MVFYMLAVFLEDDFADLQIVAAMFHLNFKFLELLFFVLKVKTAQPLHLYLN